MTLYAIYKDGRKVIQKQNESEINKINCEVHAVSVPICEESEVGNKHENSYDHHHHTKPNGDSIESHNPSPTKWKICLINDIYLYALSSPHHDNMSWAELSSAATTIDREGRVAKYIYMKFQN